MTTRFQNYTFMGYIIPGILLAGAGAAVYAYSRPTRSRATMMSAPAAKLAAPNLAPMSTDALRQFDGSDGRPIYVAIKGQIYDVSAKKEMYGKGAGYNVFAGKDASRGLGKLLIIPADPRHVVARPQRRRCRLLYAHRQAARDARSVGAILSAGMSFQ